MSNPLIVAPESGDWASGGGLLEDGKSFVGDLSADSVDPLSTTLDGVTGALDILGLVTDPLGGFFQAGVGWIIEHVGFLREPFDALLGDPAQITAVAATWLKISESLKDTATKVGDEVSSVSSWQGDAANAYRKTAGGYQEMLTGGELAAGTIAGLVTAAGMLIGATRDWVLKTISSFVERVVIYIISALASSWFTFGASLEVAVTAIEVDGEMQVVSIQTTTVKVEVQVTVYTGKLGRIAAKIAPILTKLSTYAEQMENSGLTKFLDAVDRTQIPAAAGAVNDTRTSAQGD